MHLERWHSKLGYTTAHQKPTKILIRVMDLLLQLRNNEILMKIGDYCEDFYILEES